MRQNMADQLPDTISPPRPPSRTTAASAAFSLDDGRSFATRQQYTGFEEPTLDPSHPRTWHSPMSGISVKLWRQLLGLNPLKGSYFGLYGSLEDTRSKSLVLLGAICAVAAGVPLPIIGVIFGEIISEFPPSESELLLRIKQLLGVAVAYFAVTTTYTICFGLVADKIAIGLRQKLLSSLLGLEQAYIDTRELDVNSMLTDKIDTIQVGTSEKVGTSQSLNTANQGVRVLTSQGIFIQSMSYFFAAFTVGFVLNAKLTGILLAAVIPTMCLVVFFGSRTTSRLTRQLADCNEKANAIVESALRSVKIVQAFEMIDRMCTTHHEHLQTSSKIGVRKAVVAALELGGAYFTAYAANGLAFYVGSQMAESDGGNAGTIYAVVFLILDASFVVGAFAPFLEMFARAASAFGTIQELVEATTYSNDTTRTSIAVSTEVNFRGKALRFTDVSFCYPARPTVKALNDLSLTVEPNSLTAIVGTSGGGKSTLVTLLLRVYEHSGNILIGSQNIKTVSTQHLRSQIAVVDQECVLFSGSIFDNICCGLQNADLSHAERRDLCEQACIDAAVDFLDDLPQGVDTQVDNTLQLSGGQRQRICLARALVRQPAILILDEPTSALDAQSERKVMMAIKQAVKHGVMVLMIAHRLSTTLDADHVAVMNDGHVVEEGSPRELSRPNTIFRGLLDAQNTNIDATRQQSGDGATVEPKDQKKAEEAGMLEEEDSVLHSEPSMDLSNRSLAGVFLQLTRPEHYLICLGVAAATVSGSIVLGEAIIFGNLIQLLNEGRTDPDFHSEASFFCLMFFILACIALLSYACSGTAFGIASDRLTRRVQTKLFRNVLAMDMQWFSKTGRSALELTSTFTKDSGDIACLSGVALGTIFTVITSVVGGIILAHIIAWKVAVVLLAAVPIMLVSGYVRLRLLAKGELRHRTAYTKPTSLAIEACRNRRTVILFGLEDRILKDYRRALMKPHRAGFRFTIICNTLLALSFSITYFVYALAYYWGSKQVRDGLYSQKQFFTVLPALLFSAQAAGQLFSLSPEIARARTAAVSVIRFLSYRPTILRHVEPKPSSASSSESSPERGAMNDKKLQLEFKAVEFSYQSHRTQLVLRDVNFSIHSGETIAFVGPSGAGKSSTIALIERFFDPTAGAVLFDGIDASSFDVTDLRSMTALVPQEPELFPGTIEYNIALGAANNQTVGSQDVQRCAKTVGLHDFIASLPEGYATDCGSAAGSQLSGGQRQRLSLARALIRDPKILLLDEPTSALDAHSERQVQDALQEAAKDRTTIIVAHRLASIQHVDRIFVFDEGTVVEEGKHADLMQKGGLYASMARAQALS